MNLKNNPMSSAVALVGVGLISLSGAIVFVASGRPALAAEDSGRPAGSFRTLIVADPRTPSGFEGPPPVMGMSAGDRCVETEPLEWFGEIRAVPECWIETTDVGLAVPVHLFDSRSGVGGVGMFDLNGDGRPEAMNGVQRELASGIECALFLVEVSGKVEELTRTRRCVLPGARIAQLAASLGLPAETKFVSYGWFDPDHDGDLDFVFSLRWPGGAWETGRYFWAENTGFEATQPLVGDLDGDGSVGASDLTMLLGGWTGT
jgi:hypothetical protein